MDVAIPEPVGCKNCRKVAGHIRAWTECVRLGRPEGFLQYKTVGLWEDFLSARECPNCVRLVRSFSLDGVVWVSEPVYPKPVAQEPDCSIWRECETVGPNAGEVLEFYGGQVDNRFALYRRKDENGNSQQPEYSLCLVPPQPYGPDSGVHHMKTQANDGMFDIEQFRRWLSHCDTEHHGRCHSINPDHFFQFPGEIILIDVKDNKLTVCKAKERYATLSYVWGKLKAAFETLRSNFSDLSKKDGLLRHWHELPMTIRDAIILCQSLNIPYLWVDRLCIIQDDEDSKQQNIMWMASIYANCYVAIIAAEGPDDDYGIRGVGATSRPRRGHFVFQFDDIQCGLEKEPESRSVWHTRGWTLQERTLARRCLVFHDGHVHWECEEIHIDENTYITENDSQTYMFKGPDYSFDLRKWPDQHQYSALCFKFSNRMLTYERDALDAFTSITNALTRSFPGGFLYAIPEFMFTLSLLWQISLPYKYKRRKWLPSWSWIGWEGNNPQVKYHFGPAFESFSGNHYDDYKKDRNYASMSRWKKRSTLTGEMFVINDSYYHWANYGTDPSLELPEGWTFVENEEELRGFVYEEVAPRNSKIRFLHPVPVTKPGPITPDSNTWDTLIHGRVSLTSLRFDMKSDAEGYRAILLRNACSEIVGRMSMTLDIEAQVEDGDECIIIAICQFFDHIQMRRRDWTYGQMVQVMWIGWEGNIAYRQGVGVIPFSKWMTLDVEEVDIVLG